MATGSLMKATVHETDREGPCGAQGLAASVTFLRRVLSYQWIDQTRPT
jgi:hypothetical protein